MKNISNKKSKKHFDVKNITMLLEKQIINIFPVKIEYLPKNYLLFYVF